MKGRISMSIRKKLILSYSVLIIGMIVMAVYGITQLGLLIRYLLIL